MSDINITESTVALIDSLKSTTAEFGLAGTGSEYKIVIESSFINFSMTSSVMKPRRTRSMESG